MKVNMTLSHLLNSVMVTCSTAFSSFAYAMLHILLVLLFLFIFWKDLRCA